jgi:ABC-type multidrug transport system ATPase subunit
VFFIIINLFVIIHPQIGKTTLLNILNFRNTGTLKVSGSVKINGEKINNHADLANISGYVQQDDLFISTLKVIEQLKFQVNN